MKMTGNNAFKWLNSILPTIVLAAGLIGISGFAAVPARAAGPGPEVCKNCHAEQFESFMASKHGTKTDSRTPISNGGCVVCHTTNGDATEHVKAGGGKGVGGIINPGSKTLAAADKNKICLSCHQGDPKRMHWQGSTHANRDVACTSCHKLHSHDNVRDKLTQPQVCFTCHKEQRVQVNKPSHHPVIEGKVSCSDCHNVHGSNPKQLVKDSVNETCYQCHMEKRGPFVFSHQPVTEDCTICHQPHGSTITPMLKSRPPFLCQDCHESSGHPTQNAGIPTARTAGSQFSVIGTIGRGCLNCHTNIHGSNSTQNSSNGRRFLR